MLTAGDEFARSQRGNNNAYCHDSPLTWLEWEHEPWQHDQFAHVQRLIALRQQNPALRPTRFAHEDKPAILGFFAATFGAAMETGLSTGYTVAQYFGWNWGKLRRPRDAARFHTVVMTGILAGIAVLMTSIDPIQLTEYTLVFSAVALPLTYLPILVVANDRGYLGDRVNGRLANGLGTVYLIVVLAAALAAIPLMIITRMGGG
jgi:hypothetical protein